ncbi:MAG: hypothetical protein R3F65_32815, partial [bacterium]
LNEYATLAAVQGPGAMTTSYYNSTNNAVLMRSVDAAGAPDTGAIADVGSGTGRGARAVNDQYDDAGNLTGGLNYFQNHATHEIGHAVGNKRLVKDGIDSTGDDYAKTYANWQQNGNALQYARQLGWTAAMDATTYSLTHGPKTRDVVGSDIRAWLVSRVGGTAPGASNGLKTHFNGNEMSAIKSDATLAANILVRTVDADGNKGSAFRMRHGIPNAGASVHFYSTRWGDTWVTYDKTAWDERVSHYSVSSYKEMFAEVYTAHYTGGSAPGGMQPYFTALDTAEQEHFPDEPQPGGAGPGEDGGGDGGGGDGGGGGGDGGGGAVDDRGPTAPPDAPWPGGA